MPIDWISKSKDVTLRVRNLVDGRWADVRGELLRKEAPRDGRILYEFGSGEPSEVDAAVASARRAFNDGRWSRLPVQRRKEVLYRLAVSIERHAEELALLESLDVGKPIRDALGHDIPAAAGLIRFNAEAADKFYGGVFSADSANLSYQLRRPIGVVAAVVGWNFPLVLAAGKIGPALAAGNCVVLKPSELTSLSASRIAELALAAGVPDGVLNVVNGAAGVGDALARHRGVDLISFTGSTQTGKKLLVAAGQSNMKRLILECGGKAANIVFDDCPDLEAVAEAIVARAFWNQGAVCTASSRVLIEQSLLKELLPIIVSKTAALSPGDPLDPRTTFGALISSAHRGKVLDYVDIGQKEGARLVYKFDGQIPNPGGFYLGPIIFDRVSPAQAIAREEIFGPVLAVSSFRTEQEAIELANSTNYGLSAIVWTKNPGRAQRMACGIDVGWLTVHATADSASGGPGEGVLAIGGHRESGIGVEGGIQGLEAYTTQTAVQLFL